jgi:hypothetical protein
MTPASRTTRTISAASAAVRASGFVQTIALPLDAAARIASRCRRFGSPTTTICTSSSAHSASISVYRRGTSWRRPNSSARSALREWLATTRVVGGGVADAGQLLLEPLRAELRRRACVAPVDRIPVVPAELGPHAGAVGAALWAGEGVLSTAG